jgi:hypothetical protein
LLVALAAAPPAPWSARAQVVLATLDLALVLGPYRMAVADPQPLIDLAAPLRGQTRAVWVGNSGALLANFGPVIRVSQPAGYSSLFSAAYATLVTGARPPIVFDIDRADNPALALLGYDYIVDPARNLVLVFDPPPPQVWVARCLWPGSALDVRQPDFPRQLCVASLAATGREQPVPPGPARVVAERVGWLQVEAEGPGWLVTHLPWYPGWSAETAGQPIPVGVVDGALVGVELAAGTSTVSLSYRPAGLELGLLTSTLSGVTLLLCWFVEPRGPHWLGGR